MQTIDRTDAPADLIVTAVADRPAPSVKIARATGLDHSDVLALLPWLVAEGYVSVGQGRGARVVYGPGRAA